MSDTSSAIYSGQIRHRRFQPGHHGFTYTMTTLFSDLDEIDQWANAWPILSTRKPALLSLRAKDYSLHEQQASRPSHKQISASEASDDLAAEAQAADAQTSDEQVSDEQVSDEQAIEVHPKRADARSQSLTFADLKSQLIGDVEQQLGKRAIDKVIMLAHPRYWGFIMNPLSVFYCYANDELDAVVLQVTNTPWRERVRYVLDARDDSAVNNKNYAFRFAKTMHVSPFNPLAMQYHCRLQRPTDSLFLHLENHQLDAAHEQAHSKHTDATMTLQRKPLTHKRLCLLAVLLPWQTLKVALAIYWNALRLWRRKMPIYDHPDSTSSVLEK